MLTFVTVDISAASAATDTPEDHLASAKVQFRKRLSPYNPLSEADTTHLVESSTKLFGGAFPMLAGQAFSLKNRFAVKGLIIALLRPRGGEREKFVEDLSTMPLDLMGPAGHVYRDYAGIEAVIAIISVLSEFVPENRAAFIEAARQAHQGKVKLLRYFDMITPLAKALDPAWINLRDESPPFVCTNPQWRSTIPLGGWGQPINDAMEWALSQEPL